MSVCLVLQESTALPKAIVNQVVNVQVVISVQLEHIFLINFLVQQQPFCLMLQQRILHHVLHVFPVITVHNLA